MRLRVDNLTVERGGLPILAGLSFGLEPGRALILRGPNGAGKTTLLRTLAGLQRPLAGHIEMPPDSCAYASHSDGIKPTLTVEENLRFWAQVYGKEIDEEVWWRFDLRDLRQRPAGQLSAGQTRRLGLARLAVIDRRILLLDEPTVSLDRASVRRFADFLTDRHLAMGGSALIATHIDLGLDAPELDLAPYRCSAEDRHGASDEAFL